MIISGQEAKKCILKPTALFTNKAKRAMCYIVFFYDVNLTISPLDRPIVLSSIYKGVFHEDVTYQHSLFVNNSNNHHYFKKLLNKQDLCPPMIN